MTRFYSPLRYPGGKAKLAPYIKKIIEYNNLDKLSYIEPFCGGSGVALDLLFSGIVEDIHINDLDRSIYAFWYSVLNYNDELCKLIESVEVTIEEWNIQKMIQNQKNDTDLSTLGFSTFFLNRTNRSGIMSAGMIGGVNQSGNYKIDSRFNKKNLIKRIQRIGEYSDFIYLYNLDTIDFIDIFSDISDNKKIIYFDPPYYKKGSQLYINHYKHNNHVDLKNKISSIVDDYWIVTYDNTDEIKQIYNDYRYEEFSLSYSLQKKYKGKEVIIYCDKLSIP